MAVKSALAAVKAKQGKTAEATAAQIALDAKKGQEALDAAMKKKAGAEEAARIVARQQEIINKMPPGTLAPLTAAEKEAQAKATAAKAPVIEYKSSVKQAPKPYDFAIGAKNSPETLAATQASIARNQALPQTAPMPAFSMADLPPKPMSPVAIGGDTPFGGVDPNLAAMLPSADQIAAANRTVDVVNGVTPAPTGPTAQQILNGPGVEAGNFEQYTPEQIAASGVLPTATQIAAANATAAAVDKNSEQAYTPEVSQAGVANVSGMPQPELGPPSTIARILEGINNNPITDSIKHLGEATTKVLENPIDAVFHPVDTAVQFGKDTLGQDVQTIGAAAQDTATKALGTGDGGSGSSGGSTGPGGSNGFDQLPNLPELSQILNGNQLDPNLRAVQPTALTAQNVQGQAVNYSPYVLGSAGKALVKEATRAPGAESPWLKMSTKRQRLGEQDALAQAQRQALGANSQARSALSMRGGGLTGGAAERLAKSGARDLNAAGAGVSRQGMTDRMGLGIQDEQNRLGMLGSAANMETGVGLENAGRNLSANQFNSGQAFDASKVNAANAMAMGQFNAGADLDTQRFNIGNTINTINQQDQNRLGIYNTKMAGYGANQVANQIEKSGKK